jgi:oxygen-independent coproporphyrinogen-3 oxidase
MLEAGRLALPAEEDEEAMYQLAVEFLPEHGFKRYEISNYARDGAECRHNLKYWQYQPYLGLGTAAHSFWEAKRWSNIPDIGEYLHRLEQGQSVVSGRERPDVPVAMAEFTFLALRTAAGLSFAAFHRQFGVSFSEVYGDTIDRLSAQGLVCRGREGIALSALGMKYGNKVFASFLPD